MLNNIRRIIKRYLVREKITTIKTPVFNGKLLLNKTALIVGGSGGIGSAIAEMYVANGCKVVIAGTNEQKLNSLCERMGEKSDYLVIDLKNVSEFKDKIFLAEKKLGKIDILVNCSGVHCNDKFGEISEREWNNIMDINVKGMYFMSQEFANYIILNKLKGHILNVGSASCAKPGWTPYEISKCAVQSMTRGMADKLIKHGIVVNSIAPGPVATKMLGRENGENIIWTGNPTGRMATPEEIANLAVFMVSNLGDLIVGDTYFISGGSGTVCIDR